MLNVHHSTFSLQLAAFNFKHLTLNFQLSIAIVSIDKLLYNQYHLQYYIYDFHKLLTVNVVNLLDNFVVLILIHMFYLILQLILVILCLQYFSLLQM